MDWTKLPRTDPETGDLLAVVETPRGSRHKFAYATDLQILRLKKLLPAGMVFPHNFGFIPSTKAGDGDPLDVLILTEEPLPPGTCLTIRLLGALRAEARQAGADWARNDRLIAVASHVFDHSQVKSLDDIPAAFLREIEAFFVQYNRLEDRDFRVLDICGPEDAARLVEQAAIG